MSHRTNENIALEHSSSTPEHYTPKDIVNRARECMGGIDLDPASTEEANITVRARKIYTREQNGLAHPWAGTTLINPPGSCHGDDGLLTTCYREPKMVKGQLREKNKCSCDLPRAFWERLAMYCRFRTIPEFVWIAFNLSQLRTLQGAADGGLLRQCEVLIPADRLHFSGSAPTKDNAILHWSRWGREKRFAATFEELGVIWESPDANRLLASC